MKIGDARFEKGGDGVYLLVHTEEDQNGWFCIVLCPSLDYDEALGEKERLTTLWLSNHCCDAMEAT